MRYLKNLFFLLITLFISSAQGASLWHFPPTDLSFSNTIESSQKICCDSSGNAIAIWADAMLGEPTITQVSHFDGDTLTWGNFVNLSDSSQSALQPQICCDNSGNAFAVWQWSNGTNTIIQASIYDGTSWTPIPSVFNLSADGQDAEAPQVCCDDSGNAIAIWQRSDGTNTVIQASRFNGTSWDSPVVLSDPSENATEPQICCDDSGDATAIWARSNGSNIIIQASQFDGSSWGPISDISDPGENAGFQQICCNNLGEAFAIWRRSNGTNLVIQSSYFNGSIWTLFDVSAPGFDTRDPAICCNDFGDAVAVWPGINGTDDIILASRFNGTSWSNFADIASLSLPGNNGSLPRVCCDNAGNATAVWKELFGANHTIQTSHFDNEAMSWSSPPQDLSASGFDARTPQICCNDSERNFSIWSLSIPPNSSIIQATFCLPQIFPPENFEGTQVTDQSATQTASSILLCWTPNVDPNVTAFNIFRDGVLIGTIPSSTSCYKDCTLDPCETYTYSITSVNIAGDESAAETITL